MAFGLESIGSIVQSDLFGFTTNTLSTVFSTFNSSQASSSEAEGLRAAGSASVAAANFNNAIDRINTSRRLESASRQTDRLLSSQRAAAAGSGFSSSSQSFLAVANATLTSLERTAMQERVSLKNRTNAETFSARTQQAALNQRASQAQSSGSSNLLTSLPTILSGAASILGGFS